MNDFNIGDVVELKSGGPSMTVSELSKDGKMVNCMWFSENTPKKHMFTNETLVKKDMKPMKII